MKWAVCQPQKTAMLQISHTISLANLAIKLLIS